MKNKFILILALLTSLTACAEPRFVEGKQYDVVADTQTTTPEVKEFFSFYCPHCYQFEPFMQNVEHKLPEGTAFKKMHVDFMRSAPPEIQELLTRAYVVANSQQQGDKIAMAIFNHIHRNHAVFNDAADIRQLMLINDLDAKVYDQALQSAQVTAAVKQMKNEQNDLAARRVLTGVPMLLVNGKYRINLGELDAHNLEQELQDLIAFLLEK
ncbi:thiol:disulfide interchange protein DsbA/DsbL [Rheinheimera sp. D18]|uniref:thiol:disulfide interchange protein DsbA/DsbL n=1 Tax=Rheinheimera sp. D18 TaxID=2545632 RepID=UPI001047A269|nr:thiol:disulfide interchange protein DsbA/DsbL [Rheinheimera sp. D18]QBL10779.1 thiol:disulfide interchange protein DsbA/DsbL [Rheinheimera sp. D18]